jgi:uncharacterized protein YggU (UPF0235/DUF167 family)
MKESRYIHVRVKTKAKTEKVYRKGEKFFISDVERVKSSMKSGISESRSLYKNKTTQNKTMTFYIEVKEKAERNEANARVKQLLATELGCTSRELRLIKGATSPSKTYLQVNS